MHHFLRNRLKLITLLTGSLVTTLGVNLTTYFLADLLATTPAIATTDPSVRQGTDQNRISDSEQLLSLSIHPTPQLSDQSNSKPSAPNPALESEKEELCGKPALGLVQKHQVKSGETLDGIAKKYQITTATIMGMNPNSRSGKVNPGEVLRIPPADGIVHSFANEETYATVAKKYNVRPDVLFERNGCQNKPRQIFVIGAVWKPDPVPLKPIDLTLARNNANNANTAIFNAGGYPLPYPVPVTSNYGWRMNPVSGQWAFHSGIDLGAPMGTPVLAAKSGVVEFASWGGGYGNLIEMSHGSTGTRYAHLSSIYVTPGQRVAQGQQIGTVGSTGNSTGPHLHFEYLVPSSDGWSALDPANYLNRIASR
ncbi:MAG: peptidoglycan DD-metalloendopeptidase family protein [Pseudanabaenaceae cyanobacterium]